MVNMPFFILEGKSQIFTIRGYRESSIPFYVVPAGQRCDSMQTSAFAPNWCFHFPHHYPSMTIVSILYRRLALFVGCVFFICASSSDAAPKTGQFISVAKGPGGAWCFQRGTEHLYSIGICHVGALEKSQDGQGRYYDGSKVRGGVQPWAMSAVERMADWGFNTAGAWCDESIYSRPILQTRYVWLGIEVDGIKQRLLNVFSPGYEVRINELCASVVAPHAENKHIIGWFLDNELPWYGEHGWPTDDHRSLLDMALALPAADANRKEAIQFLRASYKEFSAFQREWQSTATSWETLAAGASAKAKSKRVNDLKHRWAGHVAERFFRVAAAAVRRHAPNHLVLGSRFAGNAPGPVFAACARYCDVVSVNQYQKNGEANLEWWDRMYAMVQKPILLTEFSWRAAENRSGNQNKLGADVTVPNQADRAERYQRYVAAMMTRPYLVGVHWFQWADEPERGRFDGEDSNYGLVDWQDEAYEGLVKAIKATHAALPKPAERRGKLPVAADTDGLSWSARPLPTVPSGKLAGTVELADPHLSPEINLDAPAGTRAAGTRDGDVWKVPFDTGRGWGFNATWMPPTGKPLVGARTLRLRAEMTPGTRFHVLLFERESPQTKGKVAGDGEFWMTEAVVGANGWIDMHLDLSDMELNLYVGNQKGNRRIDLEDIMQVGFYVPGAQGQGTLRVSNLTFSE